MKVLKYIGIILLIIVIILGVLTFVLPTSMETEESIAINAPKSIVKEQILYFENSQEWSPWSKIDPNMNTWLEGEDGEVGTKYFWKGNEDAGEGVQEIVAVEENQVDLKITFIKPFESEADTYFKINEKSDKVEVTWGFTSEMQPPLNLMLLFVDMKESISEDYREGLESLKEISENIAENYVAGYKIKKSTLNLKTICTKEKL
ncbi:SRPBCC family protein [Psychroflexus aestuariivivens]|uniref:SRPBCC family protein n=1 Tax=Psychroflexus aestuariivivens TaxID=1795040 RepID=UPI000FD7EC42|nr:SRPBCC family protein [Psychroflexus aestuariivivens]